MNTQNKNTTKVISFAVMRNFLHKGHFNLISEMLKNSDLVYVLLGSSQASNDIRNPFTTKQRMDLIKLAFGNSSKLKIMSIKDINAVDKEIWESFVLSQIASKKLEAPTDYWAGSKDDVSWFGRVPTDNGQLLNLNVVDRFESGIMSGTEVRQSIANDGTDWEKHVPRCMIQYIKDNFPKGLILSNITKEKKELIQQLSKTYEMDYLTGLSLQGLRDLV